MVYKFTGVYIGGCLGVLCVWDELLARLSLKSNPWNHEGFFFFLQNSRFVGIHPPTFSHLNLPPAGAEKIWLPIYGSASWGQAAELLKASERKFLRCAAKVLRAEKEKLCLLFERSSSKWIVFCNGFCNWVQRSWMFRPWKSHKIRVFKRVEWGPGNKT